MDERVYLRALEPDDYKTSINWRNDAEINSKVGGPKYFVSFETEKKWVETQICNSGDDIVLAICLKKNDQYVGNVYIRNINWINRNANSGILLGDKSSWGKGLATEALMLALRFAFHERNLERIDTYVLESNAASIRLHEKCGYQKEGLLRNAVYKDGRYQNLFILSILRSDYEQIDDLYEENQQQGN